MEFSARRLNASLRAWFDSRLYFSVCRETLAHPSVTRSRKRFTFLGCVEGRGRQCWGPVGVVPGRAVGGICPAGRTEGGRRARQEAGSLPSEAAAQSRGGPHAAAAAGGGGRAQERRGTVGGLGAQQAPRVVGVATWPPCLSSAPMARRWRDQDVLAAPSRRRKAEEDRIRKEEEKARRELIKQEYLRRKQQQILEEQGLGKPKSRPRKPRPKSVHREEPSSDSGPKSTPQREQAAWGPPFAALTHSSSPGAARLGWRGLSRFTEGKVETERWVLRW